jgi:hypothetical protein
MHLCIKCGAVCEDQELAEMRGEGMCEACIDKLNKFFAPIADALADLLDPEVQDALDADEMNK